MRYPVNSAKPPAQLVSKSGRRVRTADWENTLSKQSPGTERPRWSPFRGVVTTPSGNTTDIRSFFDQSASMAAAEQHGHAQRLLEYRLALVRSRARPRPTDVVLD